MPPELQSITSTPLDLMILASARSGPAPAGIVLDREPHEQRLGRRPVRAHALHDFDGKAHAVQLAAAVLVVAQVGERRED